MCHDKELNDFCRTELREDSEIEEPRVRWACTSDGEENKGPTCTVIAIRSFVWHSFGKPKTYRKKETKNREGSFYYWMWKRGAERRQWSVRLRIQFDVRKSVHLHTIQINQLTRCNNFISLLHDVYVWLNMFWAPLRPSSGAYNCTRSL